MREQMAPPMCPTVKSDSHRCHTVSHALAVIGGDAVPFHLSVELLPIPADESGGLRLVACKTTEGVLDHHLFSALVAIAVAIAVGGSEPGRGAESFRET